ncbi:hypothetical protein [Streptomyces tailanensis]|uniref:hypothetical protein n=1 Tax=Streptomyces tailanensis TaxID=2569858 RepID=UPI00155A6DC0|nr:hypothetical protein [Streptomyces tailanensis]
MAWKLPELPFVVAIQRSKITARMIGVRTSGRPPINGRRAYGLLGRESTSKKSKP